MSIGHDAILELLANGDVLSTRDLIERITSRTSVSEVSIRNQISKLKTDGFIIDVSRRHMSYLVTAEPISIFIPAEIIIPSKKCSREDNKKRYGKRKKYFRGYYQKNHKKLCEDHNKYYKNHRKEISEQRKRKRTEKAKISDCKEKQEMISR